jgi:hypothetical protein
MMTIGRHPPQPRPRGQPRCMGLRFGPWPQRLNYYCCQRARPLAQRTHP